MIKQASLVVLLAGVATGCGGGSSPAPSPGAGNGNPTIASVTLTPSFGVAQVTTFTLRVSASDPNGDPLTYAWDLGDGTTDSRAELTKTYSGAGSMAVKLTVSDGHGGSATDNRTLTVGGMTGRWVVDVTGFGQFRLDLQQNGGAVTGTLEFLTDFGAAQRGDTGVVDPASPGSIDSAGAVQLRLKVGPFIDTMLRGQMDTTGRTITGTLSDSGFSGTPFTATKQ